MAQDLIADQDTGKNVAIMRGGEVFRDDTEGARVAIVLHDYLYDLNGVLVGHLKGRHVVDANTRSMPIGRAAGLVLTSVIVSSLTRAPPGRA